MEIKILKEIVEVYIRWKEDIDLNVVASDHRQCYLYRIKGIGIDKQFIYSDYISVAKFIDGWIGADIEVGEMYILHMGVDKTTHRYIVVSENRDKIIMCYEEAVDYFIGRLSHRESSDIQKHFAEMMKKDNA